MFVLALFALVAFAEETVTNCCGDMSATYDETIKVGKTCSVPFNTACPDGWTNDADTTCETDTFEIEDCVDETDVTTADITCKDVQDGVPLTDCGEAGDAGATNVEDMKIIGCCGPLPERKTPDCMCDAGLLNTYKEVTLDGEKNLCGAVEYGAAEVCSAAPLMKDLTALGCCVAKAGDEKVANPTDKKKTEIKKGEDLLVVTTVYAEADCKTALFEMSEKVMVGKCEQVELEDGTKVEGAYAMNVVNDACTEMTTTVYTDAECKTVSKSKNEKDEEVDDVVVSKADDKCEKSEEDVPTKTMAYCDVPATTDGSGVSMLSALVVLVTAAFYY